MRFVPSKRGVMGGLRLELIIITGGLIASAHASMMIIMPVMPRFAKLIGGDDFWVGFGGVTVGGSVFVLGLAFTTYGLGRFITNIPAGAISERFGRKWIIVTGGLGVAVFATLSGLVDNVPLFLVFRFLCGVASSMTIVMANVVAADLSTVENRGRMLGLMQGMQLLIGTGSPALGGLIGELFHERAPFYFSGVAVLTFALWGIVRLPETRPQPGSQGAGEYTRHSQSPRGALFLLRDASFLMVCVLGFSTFFLRGGMSTTLIPSFADEILGLGSGALGVLFTFSSLMHGILIYPAGAMADKYGRKIIIIPAGIVIGASIVWLPFADTLGPFIAAFIVLHIAQGWSGQAPVAYVADLAPEGMRGMAIGLYRTFGDAAGIIGPVVSTGLVTLSTYSYHAAFGFNALLWTVTVVVFAYLAVETAGKHRKRGPIAMPGASQEQAQTTA